jgi:hypothetical protein
MSHAQILEWYKAQLARDGSSDEAPEIGLSTRLKGAARRLLNR